MQALAMKKSKSDFERTLDVKRLVVTGHVKKQGGSICGGKVLREIGIDSTASPMFQYGLYIIKYNLKIKIRRNPNIPAASITIVRTLRYI